MTTKRETVKPVRLSGRDLENLSYLSQLWKEDGSQTIRRALEIVASLARSESKAYRQAYKQTDPKP